MKLLWVSNHPRSTSGYGSQTRQVGSRLIEAGVDIEFSANDGTRGTSEWMGATVRGSGQDRYSRDKAKEDFERSGATHAIVLYDPWVYTQQIGDPFDGLLAVAWTPVDHFPTPPSMVPWLTKHAAIAMSQYGYDRLRETSAALRAQGQPGFPVFYAPHAIEPVFAPREPAKQELLGVPDDAFVVGIVAANTGTMIHDRKGFGEMAQALSPFLAAHDDAYVYIHSLNQGPQGIRISDLLRGVAIEPDRVRFVDQYRYTEQDIPDDEMARIYSSFDVLLATSHGEGFGIPVIESQACGTPVIVSNWTAQPELVGDVWRPDKPGASKHPSGWVIPVQPWWDPAHASWFGIPVVSFISSALEDCYANHRGDAAMRAAAVERAARWGADRVFDEHWRPLIGELDKLRVVADKPNRADRRAAKRRRHAA